MIVILVNSGHSIGGVVKCSPEQRASVEKSCTIGGRCVELDEIKLAKSKLPPGISLDTFDQLAKQCFYFYDDGEVYEFLPEPKNEDE